ncbi:glycoside hydrolase family 97 protein [Chitinophaga agrisoli]|uniref:Glycoside hydrolase family 97 protein n=1 Tax=Chitinophaga agrisoli TaxID=2607653 RepID=A0A5B2VW65_9BACT|nr:glycoside hydrolase family 97 protein [Chitinophaga agrisoli]KAA2243551.1 glycoside hydrolase family 97 protein [Chitinophaga agrisoli]
MKTVYLAIGLLILHVSARCVTIPDLLSPDKKIRVHIEAGNGLSYAVSYEGQPLLTPSHIGLEISDLPVNWSVRGVSTRAVQANILSPVPEKRRQIPDHYNELTIRFRQPISLIFRVYDDGVAYRFVTHIKDSITVNQETAQFNFPQPHKMYYPEVVKRENVDSFHTSFEELYQLKPMDSLTAANLCFSPLLVAPANGPRVLITESDLEDYPGMFLTGTGGAALRGKFAPYPLQEGVTEGEFPQLIVTARAPFLASTNGTRAFPWRVLVIAATDKELPANDLVYRLAAPSRLQDVSWIKPGKGTDEWIIGINLFNVPFKTGVNTSTYKYYIDFAKRFGFNRIMMDAGWSDYKDLFKINPAINMDEIAAYAKAKGISLSMWTLAMTLDRQLEPALAQFNKWGVDFIMTDFMDRDDQKTVNFYHRIAAACARHQLMIMFHGAFKPAGFNRTWPNAVTREGVLGSEYNIWSNKVTPEHDLLLPFIRMVSGPMDYEPGIMDNATEKTFRPIGDKVMSMGTRCHQGAMFVVYDSPIQLFSGNPSQGLLEPAYMELLGSIPTVWDTTVIADARLGDYIVTARKSGTDWYIGAMTDWSPRTLEIPLHFLEPGSYTLTRCGDGVNADRYPSDYRIDTLTVNRDSTLTIRMAPGGGYLARLQKR